MATNGRLTLIGTGQSSAILFDPISNETLAQFQISQGEISPTTVAIEGTTAVVGTARGVNVYDFSQLGAIIKTPLQPSTPLQGYSNSAIDLSGDTIIVGVNNDRTAGEEAGAVYLFDRSTGQEYAKLVAHDAQPYDSFGYSVAVDGSRAVVGSLGIPTPENGYNVGAVYLFNVDPGFSGDRQLEKTTLGNAGPAFFGFDVDISGDRIVADGSRKNTYAWNAGDELGALPETYALPESNVDNGGWTSPLAMSDTLIALGFHRQELVKLYDHAGRLLARLKAPNNSIEYFGASVALAGDLLVVGAPYDNGAAYVYRIQDVLVPEPTGQTFAILLLGFLVAAHVKGLRCAPQLRR